MTSVGANYDEYQQMLLLGDAGAAAAAERVMPYR